MDEQAKDTQQKKRKPKWWLVIVIAAAVTVICIALVPVLFVAGGWGLLYAGLALSPDPPKPHITEAEFPFTLVYEIDGEQFTVSDIYVCEYDGIGMNEGVGKYRKWKGYMKSKGEESSDEIVLIKDGKKTVCASVGDAYAYMGDDDYIDTTGGNMLSFYVTESNGSYQSWRALSTDVLEEEYGVTVISWQFTPPIKNTFK